MFLAALVSMYLCSDGRTRCGTRPSVWRILVHHGPSRQPGRCCPRPLAHQDACGRTPTRTHLKHTWCYSAGLMSSTEWGGTYRPPVVDSSARSREPGRRPHCPETSALAASWRGTQRPRLGPEPAQPGRLPAERNCLKGESPVRV